MQVKKNVATSHIKFSRTNHEDSLNQEIDLFINRSRLHGSDRKNKFNISPCDTNGIPARV
jgi:hypothetical protein